jgi:hypothetical protein
MAFARDRRAGWWALIFAAETERCLPRIPRSVLTLSSGRASDSIAMERSVDLGKRLPTFRPNTFRESGLGKNVLYP